MSWINLAWDIGLWFTLEDTAMRLPVSLERNFLITRATISFVRRNLSVLSLISMDLREKGCEDSKWIEVAEDKLYSFIHFPVVPNWNIGPLSGFLNHT
jgi:hypothetical protein